MRFLTGAAFFFVVSLATDQADAGFTYGFTGSGGADLSVTVNSAKNNRANFVFKNLGAASKVTNIYFQSSSLLTDSYFKIRNYSGTHFTQNGPNSAIAFDSNHAIDPVERVRIRRQISNGNNYNDLISALDTGDLMLSLDVLIGGTTYTYTHTPTNPPVVPEPTGLALAGLGIAGLLVRRRRQSATPAEAA